MRSLKKVIALSLFIMLLMNVFSSTFAETALIDQIKTLMQSNVVDANEDESITEDDQIIIEKNQTESHREIQLEGENVDFDSFNIISRSSFEPDIKIVKAGSKVYYDSGLSVLMGEISRSGVIYAISISGNAVRIAFVFGNEVLEGYVSQNALNNLNGESRSTYLTASRKGIKVYTQKLVGISFIKVSDNQTQIPIQTQSVTVKPTVTPTAKVTITPTPGVTKIPATVVPGDYPTIDVQPNSVYRLSDSYVVFYVKARNVSTYQWQYSTNNGTSWNDLNNGSTWIGNRKSTLCFAYKKQYEGYFFRCKLTNNAGTVYTIAVTLDLSGKTIAVPSILTQPDNVSVKEGMSVSFRITASGANKYQWQCSQNASDWKDLSGGNWSGSTTANLSFTSSQVYNGLYFRCVVSNTSGTVYSNAAQLTVVNTVLPQIVLQPSDASVKLNESVSFSVQANNSSSYQWEYSQNGKTWSSLTDSSFWNGNKTNTLSFRVTDARFATYLYRVKITNSTGSVYSNTVSLTLISTATPTPRPTTVPSTIPASPNKSAPVFDTSTNSFVSGVIGSYVTLTAIVSGATAYQWQIDPNLGVWATIKESSSYKNTTSPSLVLKLTSNNLNYSYRLKATNAYGISYSQVFTLGETVSVPANVKAVASSSHEINVSWTASTNPTVNRYQIYYNTINNVDYSSCVTTTMNSAKLNGLTAGTTYYIWVQAISDKDSSDVDGRAHATVSTLPPPSKPDAPTSVSATASTTSLSISWNKPNNCEVNGYTIYYRQYSSTTNTAEKLIVNGENTLNATLTGLNKNTNYQIWVCASNESGEGIASSSIIVKTLAAAPAPSQPTDVKAVSSNSTSVKVTWTLSSSNDVAGYNVYYSTSINLSSVNKLNNTYNAASTSATVTGLKTGTTYYFWVTAYNQDGIESTLNTNVRASSAPKAVSTSNKINAVTFSQMGDKYIGTSYSTYDCQAFVERMLADAGLRMDLAGSNAWYRTMSWRGTPEQCIAKYGCIPTGAFLFIVKHDGGEPSHYRDSLGNASHIGVVTHRNGGAIHSSYSRGGVYTSVFNDATIPNGGWNMVGLWTRMDYGDTVNSILESLTGR